MDLFSYMAEQRKEKDAPLASRMRPRTLSEVVGQQEILGEGKLLRRMIQADQLSSIILYGPPGTGKTTLAHVIANTTKAEFHELNASTAGKKDMEGIVAKAKENLGAYQKKTILFIDEIHRFNKGQQDYLLPYVEDGTLVLIGATTENPYFEVNSALLSRSRIFQLRMLECQEIAELLRRSVTDERGLASFRAEVSEDAIAFLSDMADGDARTALNALELAVLTTMPEEDGRIRISLDTAAECIQKKAIRYDKDADRHYDTISAFIKSMRGSDPDAAVYYLARMLEGGEDIKFIARRMLILASEDIGNVNPEALQMAASCFLAVERVGLPEAQIILSQTCTYLATSKKNNASVVAIQEAAEEVRRSGSLPIPAYLQDAHYHGHEKLGRGIGYKYPHDYEGNYVSQEYLPEELAGREFYHFPHAHRKNK